MDNNIITLITIGYALGITLCGIMAYLGIKGTDEVINYNHKKYQRTNYNALDKLEKRIATLEKK